MVNTDSSSASADSLSYNQIISFKWRKEGREWRPALLLSNGVDSEELERLDLWDNDINIRLGTKHCIGYFSSGRHFACPDSADVGLASTCASCQQRDDWFGCIRCSGLEETNSSAQAETDAPRYDNSSLASQASYDTRIAGEQTIAASMEQRSYDKSAPVILCRNPKQRQGCMKNRYWLYLAAFDGQLKVGCSYERRFWTRMIEQGADFGCRLGLVRDGGAARALEQRVARYLGLPDKIDGAMKQAALLGEPNRSITNIAAAVAKLVDGRLFDVRPEIFDFRQFYRLGNISVRPRPVQLMPGVRLVGDVLATKGNIIVMRTAAGTISFDARRLVGYNVQI